MFEQAFSWQIQNGLKVTVDSVKFSWNDLEIVKMPISKMNTFKIGFRYFLYSHSLIHYLLNPSKTLQYFLSWNCKLLYFHIISWTYLIINLFVIERYCLKGFVIYPNSNNLAKTKNTDCNLFVKAHPYANIPSHCIFFHWTHTLLASLSTHSAMNSIYLLYFNVKFWFLLPKYLGNHLHHWIRNKLFSK